MMMAETLAKVRAALSSVLTTEELAEFESAIRVPTLHHTEYAWKGISFHERERILAVRDEQLARERAARPSVIGAPR